MVSTAAPAWCLTPRKALFLRPQAPRPQGKRRRRRGRRGASPPAGPYSFVRRHHVPEPKRSAGAAGVVPHRPLVPCFFVRKHHAYLVEWAFGGRDVVPHRPQTLISSSGSTTPLSQNAPPAGSAWCSTTRKPLFLRPEAPRPQILRPKRSSGWRSPTASSVPKSCGAPTALSPRVRAEPLQLYLPRAGGALTASSSSPQRPGRSPPRVFRRRSRHNSWK